MKDSTIKQMKINFYRENVGVYKLEWSDELYGACILGQYIIVNVGADS